MPSLATSRRTQLDFLARACARGQRARVGVRTADDPAASAVTRFLALESGSLFLYWPADRCVAAGLTRGTLVEIQFAHDGARYSFKTQVRGRAARRLPRRGLVSALVLSLPLRVERRQQRASLRISLASLDPPLASRCTGIIKRDVDFTLQIANVSQGGLGGLTTDPVADRVRVGDLFWATFDLPGQDRKTEFVVQLAHCHSTGQTTDRQTRLGCTFCPSDDPLTQQENLHRLGRFIREHQHTTLEQTATASRRRR